MLVSELIRLLSQFPQDHEVHLDISFTEDEDEQRVVRQVAGVRPQHGFNAVAIDG